MNLFDKLFMPWNITLKQYFDIILTEIVLGQGSCSHMLDYLELGFPVETNLGQRQQQSSHYRRGTTNIDKITDLLNYKARSQFQLPIHHYLNSNSHQNQKR